MKKSKLAIAVVNIIFLITIPGLTLGEPEQAAAATIKGYVKVKKKKKVRLYKLSGKHSNFYAQSKYRYPYSAKKKIGKKKKMAYKIGNNSHWILAKDVKVIKKSTKRVYTKAKMVLPSGYTKTELLSAYQGKPSKSFIDASMQGMKINDFSRLKVSESKADDETQVDLGQLTPQQIGDLTAF
ncbi:MAG: surface exclusion protein, partial [Lactobacillus sp.]|nr:surface exclusion protein [Lactobacillus sp.]